MTTRLELRAEYELLKTAHQQLLDERVTLQTSPADGAASQDHQRRLRLYMKALDEYLFALKTRS